MLRSLLQHQPFSCAALMFLSLLLMALRHPVASGLVLALALPGFLVVTAFGAASAGEYETLANVLGAIAIASLIAGIGFLTFGYRRRRRGAALILGLVIGYIAGLALAIMMQMPAVRVLGLAAGIVVGAAIEVRRRTQPPTDNPVRRSEVANCIQCGVSINSNNRFCPRCGYEQ